jgi:hypothetical protein
LQLEKKEILTISLLDAELIRNASQERSARFSSITYCTL